MKDTQSRPAIRNLQTGVSRIIMNEGIVASQIEELVHYADLAVGLVDQAMEVPADAILVVRHEVLGDPVNTFAGTLKMVMHADSELHAEITLKSRNGAWEFWNLEFMARFGPAPWAYVVSGDDEEIWRHDGQIIEWRDNIEAFLREDRKGRDVPKMRGTPEQLDAFKKLHQPAEIDFPATFAKEPVWPGVDVPEADNRSPLRRFIDWLKS